MASRFGLECDNEGFLIGTPVDLGDVVDALDSIADDVSAIRASLARNVSSVEQQAERAPIIQVATPALPPAPEANVEVAVTVDVALPRAGWNAAQSSTENTQNSQNAGALDTVTATPRQRDARGRFTGAPGAPGEAASQQQREARLFNELGDKITGALGEPPEVDPFIAAYNEVARPVGRVMKSLAGDEKKQETWLKKIWRALTDPNAQRNQGGQGQQGGGLLDGLLGLGGRGRGRGRPPVGRPPVPPVGRPPGGAGVLAGLGGFAKKLPLIGGLIAGAMTALTVLDSEADDATTRREKDETAGKGIGGLGGMVAGGFAGAQAGAMLGALAGPIGAAIGGVVGGAAGMFFGDQAGQVIGETIGGWVNDLRTADIPGMIAGAWTSVTDVIKGTFDAAMENIKATFSGMADGVMAVFDGVAEALVGAWDTLKNGAKALTEGAAAIAGKAKAALKDVTGVDLDAVAKNVTDAAKAGVEEVKTGIVNVADKANTAVRDATGVDVTAKAKEAWDTLRDGADKLKEKAEGMVTGAVAGAKTVVNNTIEGAKAAGGKAVEATKQGAKAVGNYVVNETTPGKIGKKVVEVAGNAFNALSGTNESRQAVLLNTAKNAGITNPKELANFMGQIDHETGGFNRMEENLNYSPEGFLKTFKGRNGVNTIEDARRVVAGGKESIANAAYGGDWGKKELGNTEEGDGFKYRGRGFKQLTGKDNYAQAGKALGIDLVNNPEMAQEPETAAKIAAWYWDKRVPDNAKQNVKAATRAINGGENGLDDRENRAAKWEQKIASGEADKIAANQAAVAINQEGKSSTPNAIQKTAPTQANAQANAQANTAPVAAQAPAVANLAPAVSASMPAALSMIPAPAPIMGVSDAPAVAEPMGFGSSTATSGRSDGNSEAPLIGQDLRDRRIAHVVTGGLSNFA